MRMSDQQWQDGYARGWVAGYDVAVEVVRKERSAKISGTAPTFLGGELRPATLNTNNALVHALGALLVKLSKRKGDLLKIAKQMAQG
jgi:hypothetical protein